MTSELDKEMCEKNWSLLTRKQKLRIAREVVSCRSDELKKAYPCITSLGYGLKFRCARAGSGEDVCVTFFVAEKWRSGGEPADRIEKELPKHLFTYSSCSRKRRAKAFAVPTDVEREGDYSGVAQRAVTVKANGVSETTGMLGGLVKVGNERPLYALTCQHVATQSHKNNDNPFYPIRNSIVSSNRLDNIVMSGTEPLITSHPDGDGRFLDAALVPIKAGVDLKKLFQDISLVSILVRMESIKDELAVLNGDSSTPKLRFLRVREGWNGIEYPGVPGKNPAHYSLLEFQVISGNTKSGDCGSPVVDPSYRLVGIHVAGSSDGKWAYAVPADYIFSGAYFNPPCKGPIRLAYQGFNPIAP